MSRKSSLGEEDRGEDSNESNNVRVHTPSMMETETNEAVHHEMVDGNASESTVANADNEEIDSTIFESQHTKESIHVDEDGYTAEVDMDCDNTLKKEELIRKLQEVGFAIRTDIMTLPKRLIIRKRLRDQAETNVERNINMMKTKLNNLKYLCFDSDSLQQLNDLRKGLDIILKCATHMCRTAEAYGFVRHEDSMKKAVSIIIRQIESIERAEMEASVSPDSNCDGTRAEFLAVADEEKQEDRLLRRRSVAALTSNGTARRRASIASMPRNANFPSDATASQSAFTYMKSGGGTSKRSPMSPLAARDQSQARSRKESRSGEERHAPKCVQKFGSDSITDEKEDSLGSSGELTSLEDSNGETSLVRTSSGFFVNRQRTDSVSCERQNVIDALRNVFPMRNCRFQLPNTPQQYASFFFTWYVVLLVAIIYMAGFFLGFSRCIGYQLVYLYSVVYVFLLTIGTCLMPLMRIRFFKWMVIMAVVLYVHDVIQTFAVKGPEEAFKKLGLEKHYNHGPHPV